MQTNYIPSNEDRFLDALLDQFTINPYTDLPTVLTRVDQLREAHTTGVKKGQDLTEQQQQQHAAALQKKWTDVTKAARQQPNNDVVVATLTSDTARFLEELCSAVDFAKTLNGWYALSAAPSPPLSHVPGLVTSTLLPLLAHLSSSASELEVDGNNNNRIKKADQPLRCAYLHLLPYALHAAVGEQMSLNLTSSAPSETNAVAWYCRYASDSVVHELLTPYLSSTVEQFEKELRYHFTAGRDTAAVHEPQHFFSFLYDCVTRQQEAHKCTWVDISSVKTAATTSSSSQLFVSSSTPLLQLLDHVGQLTLTVTAVVTFQSCYGWQPHSLLWRSCPDYVVVAVNAVLDFVTRAEGPLCKDAIELLLRHLLVEDVLMAYARAGVVMANAALQNGATRLWRRSFLIDNAPQPRCPLYTCSLHMVRALEAFLRRLLNTLFVVDATCAALVWSKTVEPVLSHFLEVVEAHVVASLETTSARAAPLTEDEGDGAEAGASWHTVLTLQWCVASVQVVVIAAEDWLGMLRESAMSYSAVSSSLLNPDEQNTKNSKGFLSSSDSLDGLVLFRDKLARRAAAQAKVLTRQMCSHKMGDAACAAALLYGLNAFLQQAEALPDESSRYILQAVIQGVVHESLTREQLDGLKAFASRGGLPCVAYLLSS